LHKRNKHIADYNFSKLIEVYPELRSHVFVNTRNNKTLNFADAQAVKALNTALLKFYYNIDF